MIMKEPLKFEIDGKQVTFFKNEDKGAPIIYANMHTEVGHSVIEQCKKLGCRPFHLVSITGLRWDEELSLGDLESRAKNPFLSQVENCMKELYSLYKRKGIKSVFELNPGNHFRDVPDRAPCFP